MVEVSVTLHLDAAQALGRRAQPTGSTEHLLAQVEELGVSLEPVHPGESDPLLAPHYRVEVEDEAAAERVAEALRREPAVAGAYVKPAPELP
jgi:hypothetical protein